MSAATTPPGVASADETRHDAPAAAPSPAVAFDVTTILAIAAVAYVLRNVAHELVGHGGVSVLVGGEPRGLSSAWWDAAYDGTGPWARRAVRAGGTLVNLLLGVALIPAWNRLRDGARPHLAYFVWLFIVINLLGGAGYLLADPIGGFGDWTRFLEGLEPHGLLRVGLVLPGLLLSGLTILFARRSLELFIGGEAAERGRRKLWLCLGPYVLGGLAFTLAGLLNPYGPMFALTSALSTFGGAAFLAWLPAWMPRPNARTPSAPIPLARSRAWQLAGGLALLLLFAVLGPGISF